MNDFWEPLPPVPEVKAALDEFDSWGAVVEHYLFAAPAVVDGAAHEMAAKSGLEATVKAGKQRAPLWDGGDVDWSKIQFGRATRWTPAQFLGSHFDFTSRKPLLRFPGAVFLHPFDDEANAHSRRARVVQEDFPYGPTSTEGYSYALLDPPYGLGRFPPGWRKKEPLLRLEIGTAFLHLCDMLFGDLNALEVYDWPTDCSDYFEPGYEWWGSSFWTVHMPSKNWIVTIIASSTD